MNGKWTWRPVVPSSDFERQIIARMSKAGLVKEEE